MGVAWLGDNNEMATLLAMADVVVIVVMIRDYQKVGVMERADEQRMSMSGVWKRCSQRIKDRMQGKGGV